MTGTDHGSTITSVQRLASGEAHITFHDERVTEPECDAMLKEITEAIRTVSPRLAIGCGALSHVSSAMLGTLIRVRNRAAEAGGGMVLFDLPESIRDVITLTRLDAVFPIADTLDDAIKRLADFPADKSDG